MSWFEAVLIVVIPLLLLLVPGIFLIRIRSRKDFWPGAVRILLWSLSTNTIALMLGLLMGVAVQYSFIVITCIAFVMGWMTKRLPRTRLEIASTLFAVVLILVVTMLFAISFLKFHDGLPTGDVQKTILFAQESVKTHHLPNYGQSFVLLNRDPVDFYTPGLHALSAFVLAASPAPLISIGMFSIVATITIAMIAAAITNELFTGRKYRALPLIASFLLLTQFRFLRYLREPGYHYQNIFGEIYLFGMLFLFLSFIRKKRIEDAILFFMCCIALFYSHQFSAFIAAWAFLFGFIALAVVYTRSIVYTIRTHIALVVVGIIFACIGVLIAIVFGLIKKVPSIFTLHPHLAGLLPAFTDYPSTMGAVWFIAGVLGVVLLLVDARLFPTRKAHMIVFAVITTAILVLSQGPAIGIDIPPIRALFYSALPLSISGAYFFYRFGSRSKPAFIVAILTIAIASIFSLNRAYASLSHTVSTNSTLSGQQQEMIARLARDATAGGVLIDDFNRRAASWLVLSGHPMMTRISADLQTQMNESSQSKLRHDLYINQLDYEKIFALGSMPIVATLMQQHQLEWVTGIQSSSLFAFSHNPALASYGMFDDATVFQLKHQSIQPCPAGSQCAFLLQPSTLANDIGDDEDTFEHLEASIRTARLSNPIAHKNTTYRETTAQYIPLEFNVGDYAQVLWDPQHTGKPQSALQFMIGLTTPAKNLILQTASGQQIPLKQEQVNTVILNPGMVSIDERGFITLTIVNSNQERVGVDFIALGI